METQERLFRLAPEAVALNAWWCPGEGWRLRVIVRRGDETWQQAHDESYSHLTTAELADVVSSDLTAALGL